jgi:hypothetical protein
MNIFEFMTGSPWLSVGMALILAYIIAWPFRLVNRWIRHRNIAARGWPPPHLDADGDRHEDCDCAEEAA